MLMLWASCTTPYSWSFRDELIIPGAVPFGVYAIVQASLLYPTVQHVLTSARNLVLRFNCNHSFSAVLHSLHGVKASIMGGE
jgi:hypothetical protein